MGSDFITDKDLYLDAGGNLVDSDDPNKLTKLAGKGSRVSPEDVEKYGLSQPAPALKGKLPDDFPGHGALEAEGITTYAKVRKELAKEEPFKEITGIGKSTAEKIRAAMDESSEAEEEQDQE